MVDEETICCWQTCYAQVSSYSHTLLFNVVLPTAHGFNKEYSIRITKVLVGCLPGKKGLAWVAWTELTKPKNQGGLGLREIQSFILAKQSWQILSRPEGLLTRMLLSKYCCNRNFLKIDPKPSCFHWWRGILAGRDLLKQNLGKAIGNGKTTNIWRDPWTTLLKPGITTGPTPRHAENWRVADLLMESKPAWDIPKVQTLFPELWEEILLIKPSITDLEDKYIWSATADGEYSTPTGYFTVLGLRDNIGTNQGNREFD